METAAQGVGGGLGDIRSIPREIDQVGHGREQRERQDEERRRDDQHPLRAITPEAPGASERVKEISFKVTPRVCSSLLKRGAGGATRMRLLFGIAVLVACLGCGPLRGAPVRPPAPPRLLEFEATAYSETGTTASGMQTRPGIVAADPAVLPLGSRIRVYDAGAYSGVYTVADTGPGLNGREIDIFIPDVAEAKRFGRRRVHVEILER